jgi:type I restriction enzyme, S subunit
MNNLRTELTFKDVDEGWATVRLGDVVSFSKGKGISKDDIVTDGKTECIRYGELYTTYVEVIKVVVSKTNIDKNELVFSEINDIIIPSSGETQIDIARASCVLKNGVALGGDLNILKTKLDAIYLSYYLNSAKKQEIARMAQGISVVHLYASQLQNLIIHYPLSIIHSTKIASCLSSLDEVISAHAQKLEHLKDHKKGLMQNLFPQEGEKVPKWRFKEFEGDGEWVEQRFEQLFQIGNGRDYKHLKTGAVPVYGSGGYMLSVDDFLYEGESVCIGRKGTIDKPFFLTGKFWTVDTLFYTHSFKNCSPKYIYYVFEQIKWREHNEAGGVPSLTKNNIYNIAITIPMTLAEQQKIASCLSSIDTLITAEGKKIAQLKLHKKGLMQGLFPRLID